MTHKIKYLRLVLGDSAFVIISIITVKLLRYNNYHDNNKFEVLQN